MSLLTEKLPDSIIINDNKFPIKTDFRHWIKVTQIMMGQSSDIQKIADICSEVFCELPKASVKLVLNAVMDFYSPPRKVNLSGTDSKPKRQYDFEYDAELIYAAFLQQYGIDLTSTNMHWWKFKALFNTLDETTQFVKVIGYRSINLSEIKNKEQKKHYGKMKHIYRLPDSRTEEEKEEDMNNMIAKMF